MGWLRKLLARKTRKDVEKAIEYKTDHTLFTENAGTGLIGFIAGCKGAELDPFERAKDILKEGGIAWSMRWSLVVQVAIKQYDLAQFSRMLSRMDGALIMKTLPTHNVTYGVCVKRSMEEIGDELAQIQGLLVEAMDRARDQKTLENLEMSENGR